ncbi:hypothetical protein OH456_06680 [Vibrio sp. La 4.2.2]|uniref:hypothetical protein n=1 Tax=Vibrio sp. La 4.2.2 TaxID=2998830 RepID=UPI0022CDDBB1|nr:hypothetical protein [Vibrio sp. La 4.2.2]MDA0107820.1 hypothetical protein [Vibrio sp. La 4.2.2]
MTFEDILEVSKRIHVLDLGAKCYSAERVNYHDLMDTHVCGVDVSLDNSAMTPYRPFDQEIEAVIGDGSSRLFYVTECEDYSSLFEPNPQWLAYCQTLNQWLKVKQTPLVDTVTLNTLELYHTPDFIKSTLQGADLYAIVHGNRYFEHALVVEIKVAFLPLYLGQPLFSEIELLMRKRGFVFHTFTTEGAGASHLADPTNADGNSCKQWLWSHAVFIRDIFTARLAADQYLKMAMIAHNVYQSYDLALHCLKKSEVDESPYHAFLTQEWQGESFSLSDF